jgi:hypothetical protein
VVAATSRLTSVALIPSTAGSGLASASGHTGPRIKALRASTGLTGLSGGSRIRTCELRETEFTVRRV